MAMKIEEVPQDEEPQVEEMVLKCNIQGSEGYEIAEIPVSEIYSDESFNCRGHLAPMDVMDLVPDIRARGLDVPITVRPYTEKPGKKWRIVTGHRRFLAVRLLEWPTIPCRIRRNLKPFEENILNLTENIKRLDLNMLQEARGLIPFKEAGWRDDITAAQVGMSRGWVQVRMNLLELPEDVQQEAAGGMLSQAQVRQIYTIREDKEAMYALVRQIKERREAGESEKILIRKRINPYRKEFRKPAEIHEFQAIVNKVLGAGFATELAGWCAGANNDYEIHRALRDEAKRVGRFYEIPREILEKL